MTAIRSVRAADGQFVILSNQAGQDKRLSWQARGLVYFVLSLPPEQHLTAAWLETQAPNGRESLRSALRELEQSGYYRRAKTSVGRGKWEWDQVLSDAPIDGFTSDGNPSYVTTCGNITSSQVATSDGNPSDENPSDKELKDVEDLNTKDEVLSPRANTSLTDMLAAAVPEATEREIEDSITEIQTKRSPHAYLHTIITNGTAASFVGEIKMRNEAGTDDMWSRAMKRAQAREANGSGAYYDNPGGNYGQSTGNSRALQAIEAGLRVQAAMDQQTSGTATTILLERSQYSNSPWEN